jgi:putative endonuclease
MYLYILKSAKTGRYYVGATEDIGVRLEQHNAPESNPSVWTRSRGPWELLYSKEYPDKRSALRAEQFVKKMKSRAFIEKLVSASYTLPSFDD